MDTGKIFLGIALLAFSAAMVINPASAAGCDSSCTVGSGDYYTPECGCGNGTLQDMDDTLSSTLPAICCINPGNMPLRVQRGSLYLATHAYER
jgi:hypothetical protein